MTMPTGPIARLATFSPCGSYRYRLDRAWTPPLFGVLAGFVLWVMLNPSMADARVDDPTIRRTMGFSMRWGFSRSIVANLFGWRSTDPDALHGVHDPVGPDNDDVIRELARDAARIVVAWGSHPMARARAEVVLPLLGPRLALRLTKTGAPEHPLYVPAA